MHWPRGGRTRSRAIVISTSMRLRGQCKVSTRKAVDDRGNLGAFLARAPPMDFV